MLFSGFSSPLSPTGYTVCRDFRRYQPNVKKKCRFLLMITTGNGLAPFQLHKMSYFFRSTLPTVWSFLLLTKLLNDQRSTRRCESTVTSERFRSFIGHMLHNSCHKIPSEKLGWPPWLINPATDIKWKYFKWDFNKKWPELKWQRFNQPNSKKEYKSVQAI